MVFVTNKGITGKKEAYWITYIKRRIKLNKNFLGFISGPTGSGKSYSCLRISEELDPDFKIDQCVFGAQSLMELVNSGTLKRGSVILFEEAGVGMSNKNWQSQTNKLINYLLQTFRHRGFILLMNSPHMDFVDSSTRKLFHAEFKTVSIDYNKNKVVLRPKHIQYNAGKKKFYNKYLQVVDGEDDPLKVVTWSVDIPSRPLRLAYEDAKTAFTDKLNKEILDELKAKSNGRPLTLKQQEVLDHLRIGKTVEKIADLLQISIQAIYEHIGAIKTRGYLIKPVRENGKVLKYEVIDPSP